MRIKTLYILTRNPGKLSEFKNMIEDQLDVRLEPLGINKLEIQSSRLEDVAVYSAVQAFVQVGKPLIVEDAGLFIRALNGFPGVYSSYVYETIGVRGILKLMEDVKDRRALFKSVVAFAYDEGVKVFTGTVTGNITEEERGSHGFGFDPIFIPEGSTRTFAEMSLEEKNRLSHRGKAVSKLIEWLKGKV